MPSQTAPKLTPDVLVIGAGPAGLAVCETLLRKGCSVQVIDKGPIGNHIRQYPPFMRFFSTAANLMMAGFPLSCSDPQPTRREYLSYLDAFAEYHELPILPWCEAEPVRRLDDGAFSVAAKRANGEALQFRAKAVVLAVGAWEQTRRLNVPGEDLPKVHAIYLEPRDYRGQRVLIVGGRNGAAEAALLLHRAGAQVTMAVRRSSFEGAGLKYWLRPDLENRIREGSIAAHFGAQIIRIENDAVLIRTSEGENLRLANDFVLPQIGYDPPLDYLRACGVGIEPETNRPIHNAATLESEVPGLYVAGVMTAGNVSGAVFIENCRNHGELIAVGLGGGRRGV